MHLSSGLVASACASSLWAATAVAQNSSSCKCIPGDACWPTANVWAQLNKTVHGRLISNKPLAHICHDPDYDEAACNALKSEWVWPIVFQDAPTAMMDPVWQSCNPFSSRTEPCNLGRDAVYSINVSTSADMAAGIKFARDNNVRLTIKNTGHDFLGKSTGTGSLSLWTHHMRDISVLDDYSSDAYSGPAMKLAAGVRGTDALPAANAAGYVVLTGNCPTVGLVGGWTQGGGHSPLSSIHGMGADQVLEWEAVTASGELVTASPTRNPDLYWALSGGGPGAYAVAVSVTVRIYPDLTVGGATVAFAKDASLSNDTFWEGVRAFLSFLPSIVDEGGHAGISMTSAGFQIHPLTLPGADTARVRAVMAPYITTLQSLGIPFQYNVTSFPSFYTHYETFQGPIPRGTMNINVMMGGRFIPRTVVEADHGAALTAVFRELLEVEAPDLILAGVAIKTTDADAVAPNAVLPQWRSTLLSVLAAIPWDFSEPEEVNRKSEKVLNNVVVPHLKEITPGSGTYLNEASYLNPTWQNDYYGENYNRLRSIKKKWDPSDLFYGPTMVGSDAWIEVDGRLCRA